VRDGERERFAAFPTPVSFLFVSERVDRTSRSRAAQCPRAGVRRELAGRSRLSSTLQRRNTMNLHLTLGPIVALIAGILILLMPKMLNYIVAIYLILVGILGLVGQGVHLH
jgi:hypothetical protein